MLSKIHKDHLADIVIILSTVVLIGVALYFVSTDINNTPDINTVKVK